MQLLLLLAGNVQLYGDAALARVSTSGGAQGSLRHLIEPTPQDVTEWESGWGTATVCAFYLN